MSQLSVRAKNTNPDFIYYDIVTTNFQSVSTDEPFLRFSETRNNPIVPNSGDYFLSITRFSLDTYNLPTLICEIQPNQGGVNNSIYSITMDYVDANDVVLATGSQTYLNWVAQNRNTPQPLPPNALPNGLQDSQTNYYYCYSFQYFVTLMNATFQTAFGSLLLDPGSAPVATAKQPIIYWDETGMKAIINAESQYYNQLNSVGIKQPRIRIFFNPALFSLFNSFATINFGISPAITDGKNYQIVIGDFLGDSTILLPTNAAPASQIEYTQVFQEFSTIDTWTPVSSIVFTSNTLPIVANQLSSPQIFNNNQLIVAAQGNNANFAQIITDMETNQQVFKPQILYNPTAEYRRIAMTGNTPIADIDIEVYWRDKLGRLIPFYLPSGGSATIKFLFEKKEEAKIKDLDN